MYIYIKVYIYVFVSKLREGHFLTESCSSSLKRPFMFLYVNRRRPSSHRAPTGMTEEDQFGSADVPYPDPCTDDTLQNDKNLAYQLHRTQFIEECTQKPTQCPEHMLDTSTYGKARTIPLEHCTYPPTRTHVYEQPRFV